MKQIYMKKRELPADDQIVPILDGDGNGDADGGGQEDNGLRGPSESEHDDAPDTAAGDVDHEFGDQYGDDWDISTGFRALNLLLFET